MRKILIALFLFFAFNSVQAFEVNLYKFGEEENLVNKVGFNLLNSSRIPTEPHLKLMKKK